MIKQKLISVCVYEEPNKEGYNTQYLIRIEKDGARMSVRKDTIDEVSDVLRRALDRKVKYAR